MSLDFKFKAVDIGTDKLFYGLESYKDLKFTRLHTSFEFFLPKLIVSLSKDPNANFYRIRPGVIPIAIILLIAFALIIGLINSFRNLTEFERLLPFLAIGLGCSADLY